MLVSAVVAPAALAQESYRTVRVLDAPAGSVLMVGGVSVDASEPVLAPGDGATVQVTLPDGEVVQAFVLFQPGQSTTLRVSGRRVSGFQLASAVIVPGLPQFAGGRRTVGLLVWGGLAASAVTAVLANRNYDDALSEYTEAIRLYDLTRGGDDAGGIADDPERVAVEARTNAEAAYASLERSNLLLTSGLAVGAVLYVVAVIDGVANHGLQRRLEIERSSLSLAPTWEVGPRVALRIQL